MVNGTFHGEHIANRKSEEPKKEYGRGELDCKGAHLRGHKCGVVRL